MKNSVKLAILLALVLSPLVGEASVLIEPYGGYSVGTVGVKSATVEDSGSLNGWVYGGRAGFLFNHFALVAVEYQGVTGKEKLNLSPSSVNWSQHTYFGTLGVQAPFGFRLLASYGWDFEADESSSTPTHYKGTAIKFGVGWHLLPEMAVNAEYTIYSIKNYSQGAVSGAISDLFSKYDYSAAMVTLSFPLDFLHFGHDSYHNKSRGY